MTPHSSFPVTSDNIAIYIALICAGAACVLYLVQALSKRESRTGGAARVLCYVSAAGVAYALAYLLQCILSGARYDIAYVADHSSMSDAVIYRLSALWAGQEGSLLLWVALAALTGLFLLRKTRGITNPARSEGANPTLSGYALMSFWCSVQSVLLTLLVLQDPFKKLMEFDPNSTGSGMNALLRNPWMVIHPPVVFLAYALLIVPAALALQAIVDGDSSGWAKRCLPWALGGWVAMTAGLVLGMIWSYEVLGWGGYWGWDPVENASLVPWLLSTALVHGLVLQKQRGRMVRWNIVLAFATFLAVLYATYLTRSGIASQSVSVHSFSGDKGFRHTGFYQWMKWASIGYCALCVGFLAARWNMLRTPPKSARVDSRDTAISAGIVVVCLLALVVLVGTTYTVFNPKSHLDPIFYTVMSIPLATVAALLISLSPLVIWGGGPAAKGNRSMHVVVAIMAVAAAASAVVSAGSSKVSVLAAGLLLACAIVAVVSSLIACRTSSLRRCGAYVAHVGIAVMIVGVVLSATGKQAFVDLTQGGARANALGYSLGYVGRERMSADTEAVQIAAEKHGTRFMAPLPVVQSSVFRPYIRSSIAGDLYINADKLLGSVVAPTMSLGDKGWIAHPFAIPGSKSTLALLGMSVEQHAVTLQYEKSGTAPVRFELGDGRPANVDGFTFSFRGYTSNGEQTMERMVAGVNVGVEGNGQRDVAIIRVSTKPFIWTLWLGTVLIMLGGALALVRRRTEK